MYSEKRKSKFVYLYIYKNIIELKLYSYIEGYTKGGSRTFSVNWELTHRNKRALTYKLGLSTYKLGLLTVSYNKRLAKYSFRL